MNLKHLENLKTDTAVVVKPESERHMYSIIT